ncbi:hypothetical protein TPHA_0L02200 [Tetrapisispora phaffii CBS 4417]|uniref:Uncharacterized protein n=1 Tax=Tetrapisispora phaffii (strain ATCC 24235 / CBS 4417 / NBRC 1672 / NRRL Y-8282 / UCD 70-5) TaxID=1071381 RepID=G8C093_TETPH|nr:hypothetical protein TPHA_0L02200 [Tetrapisispora phaffii CBS 4417]CCE65571.1 hypothetical protein TPHA_0L02200 [Tetrapisispora phaffii CBS 4417]
MNNDDIPDDSLPSYQDVLNEDKLTGQGSQSQSSSRPPQPQSSSRPPQPQSSSRPPQPQSSSRPPQHPNRPAHLSGHSNPSKPGKTTHSSSKPAKPSNGSSSSQQQPPSQPTSKLPWVYPPGYYCQKCCNTGFKLKNGKSCKTCWRKFSRQNNVSSPLTTQGYYTNHYQRPVITPTAPKPLIVRPGDPRLGGVICGNCRGTGRIRFFLDSDLCHLCGGVGRIIQPNSNAHVTF